MTKPLSDAEISEAITLLTGWERDGDLIRKTVKLGSYAQGLAYAAAAGMIADGFNHHPDIIIKYKQVILEFTTHDAGSKITRKDMDVAAAIDTINIRL